MNPSMGLTESFFITLAMALAFCAVHIFIGKLRFLNAKPRSKWLSFAGGVSVGYVFLHVMPELAAHGDVFAETMAVSRSLAESLVYALSLGGLVLFYGLERALSVTRDDHARSAQDELLGRGAFWLHMAASALLVFVIAYLLNHREDEQAAGLALFFVALLLHFVTADYGARIDYPQLYDARGRWLLVAATLAGWLSGVMVEIPELAVGCLFAFVGGGIILVVLKEELPEDRASRFLPFFGGTALYGALVLGEVALKG